MCAPSLAQNHEQFFLHFNLKYETFLCPFFFLQEMGNLVLHLDRTESEFLSRVA